MEQKRGGGKTKILKRGQAGSRGGCVKMGGAGTPLRTMKDFYFNNDYRNKKSACVIFQVKKLVLLSIIFF